MKLPAILLSLLLLSVSADEIKRTDAIIACIKSDMVEANKEWRLSDSDLKTFTDIVDTEARKDPLKKKTPKEQRKILENIEDSAHKQLRNLPIETVDKITDTLKIKAMHCKDEKVMSEYPYCS
ncbi:hypothetical protein BDV39DRAFT_202188 [Aspergillus sergii]|uniref:Uncharacterized protein n=1 Tax=Aspergillus sergii TaxID=1034303 RepID=A0A5N6XAV2_9EURO|nr:hypothetical protein BDV39DRAFT_202188 [Aspergillus sergii]